MTIKQGDRVAAISGMYAGRVGTVRELSYYHPERTLYAHVKLPGIRWPVGIAVDNLMVQEPLPGVDAPVSEITAPPRDDTPVSGKVPHNAHADATEGQK